MMGDQKLKQKEDANHVFSSNQPGGSKINHAFSTGPMIVENAPPTSIASLSFQQLQDMIAATIRAQHDGPSQRSFMNKAMNVEELATRAHDMEINIANHGGGNHPTVEHNKYKNGTQSDKLSGASIEESMAVNMVPLKVPRRDKKNEEYPRDKRPTLKELQEKRYPFPNSDEPSMLEDLLEKNVIQLPKCKHPEEMGKVHDLSAGGNFQTIQFGLFDSIVIQCSSKDVPIQPHQVKKRRVKKSSPRFTVRDKVNDGKDKKEKVLEKSYPTPITQHDFFHEGYFDDDCFQTVYMISTDEKDDINQSFTRRVSAFDHIEAPTTRTSVCERLNQASRENKEANSQPRRSAFSRLKDTRVKSKAEHKKQKMEEAMVDSTKEDEETRSSIPSRMKCITSLEINHDGPLKVKRLTIVLTKLDESQLEDIKKEQVVSIIP
ncbi:hypothetical protein Vadar_030078 [Vaccinium darrowii]|uniref:Uncharacterized protein n=1 Tax=Vaccinium darrowii TaxID=229202 RepID=A0ACB7XV70_9ERIC|nr:hypothetical protein Vadar_030078 [Vaccinium darrowii]